MAKKMKKVASYIGKKLGMKELTPKEREQNLARLKYKLEIAKLKEEEALINAEIRKTKPKTNNMFGGLKINPYGPIELFGDGNMKKRRKGKKKYK